MAKLERKNFKVFAENAPLEEMGQFGSAVATTKKNTKDIEEIQELEAWQQGWGGAVISNKNYPPMEEMNGALNVMSYQTAYTLQEGIPEWNKDTVYYTGSIVKTLVDNKVVLYQSLKNNNIGNVLDNSEYWEKLSLGGSGLQMFDTVLKDHILSFEESKGLALQGTYVYKEPASSNRYGYPDFYAKCMEEKVDGLEVEIQLEENTITVYKNMNGHIFYNIADKDVVDLYYIHTGACWMYGIDEENERIFLPRNDWFTMNGKSDEVGEFVEAGLPNITGSFWSLSSRNADAGANGAFAMADNGCYSSASSKDSRSVNFDASRSSSVYGKSDTVQPAAVKKLLYMVVGNTEVTSSITNVTEVTTSENDTIPLGCSRYSGGILSASAGWLKSSGQWNSGDLYTSFYNMAVSKIGQPFASGTIVENTSAYTDYDLVVNQTDMTFRLPLLDGSESIPGPEKYTYTLPTANNQTYTALYNGIIQLNATSLATNQYVSLINETTGEFSEMRTPLSGVANVCNIQVKAGDTFTVKGDNISTINWLANIKYVGNGTLYFKVANAVQNLELLNAAEVMEAVNNVVPDNSSVISSYAMPSGKYIDLTLGTNGSSYTAPANGWVNVMFTNSTACNLHNITGRANVVDFGSASKDRYASMPISKGHTFRLYYAGNLAYFQFVYAEGEV